MPVAPVYLLLTWTLAAAPASAPETAADVVTLRDGKSLLGQVVEPTVRGSVVVLVRRAWAEANLPDWSARWQSAEAAALRRARSQRRDRLSAWRRERGASVEKDDRILGWIDRELAGLAEPSPAA